MSALERTSDLEIPADLARVSCRRILVFSPVIRFKLAPGDRTLVQAGDRVVAGMPIAERSLDVELVDVGKIALPNDTVRPTQQPAAPQKSSAPAATAAAPVWKDHQAELIESRSAARGQMATRTDLAPSMPPQAPSRPDRRRPPYPGKWWIGGDERRGKNGKGKVNVRVGGTLLYETNGRWRAAAGEHHQIVEAPVAGLVREARNSVGVTIEVTGAAIPGALAAGEPSRGYLDVPRLTDGELWASALDVGRSGAVVVAGSRISAQAISRARAMSIRGLVAGSVGEGELRDLAASELRQKASLAPSVPFGLFALDGHQRRPLPTPVLALLAALAGREVAIVTDPPLLVFDVAEVPLPELPPEWIRVRSGQHAGREGRWIESAGLYRFRGGVHLDAAVIRFVDETETTIIPVTDLERFVF